MLKLRASFPFGDCSQYLVNSQAIIDGKGTYEEKVLTAKEMWGAKNKNHFITLRTLLEQSSIGSRRCHYCEDSAADEVEHIWPKKFYPEKAFVWTNYLFACGPCNGSNKNDQFAVFDPLSEVLHISRGDRDPVVPPAVGAPVLLNPHVDDPMAYMELDLATGLFVPIGNKNEIGYKRAHYTIRVLGLNKRDYLSHARRNAYGSYIDSIKVYVKMKQEHASSADLAAKRSEIIERHHPSVWLEIKRLAVDRIQHHEMFDQAPELFHI